MLKAAKNKHSRQNRLGPRQKMLSSRPCSTSEALKPGLDSARHQTPALSQKSIVCRKRPIQNGEGDAIGLKIGPQFRFIDDTAIPALTPAALLEQFTEI